MKYAIEDLLAKLPLPANEKWKEGVWDVEPFKKNNVSLVLFAPKETDYQTFHDEDEFYFIIRGTGKIIIDDEEFDCDIGDAFFVPAKVEHCFEDFTEDFAAWAVFFSERYFHIYFTCR